MTFRHIISNKSIGGCEYEGLKYERFLLIFQKSGEIIFNTKSVCVRNKAEFTCKKAEFSCKKAEFNVTNITV